MSRLAVTIQTYIDDGISLRMIWLALESAGEKTREINDAMMELGL